MCRTYNEAQRWYYATADFLKTRLKLDVSPEKSKVINMKKNSSTYLGFKIKVVPKGKTRYGFIAKTDMSDKAIRKAKTNLKAKIINIQKHTSYIAIDNYNSAVRGIQNYYCIATNVYNNLTDVSYALLPTTRIRLRDISKTVPFRETDIEFQRKAIGIRDDTKIVKLGSQTLLPITAVRHRSPMNFSQDTTNYTAKGREKIHSNLEKVTELEFEALARGRDPNESVEFNDNRISAFVVQQGNCYITGLKLNANDMKCFRKIPLSQGGTNKHGNIAFVEPRVFNLIFNDSINEAKMQLATLKLEESKRNRLNKIRRNYGYQSI